jgi:hypothetical protein
MRMSSSSFEPKGEFVRPFAIVHNPDAVDEAAIVSRICKAISCWYVRRDEKFYDIDRLTARLSRTDVERACIWRIKNCFKGVPVTSEIMRDALDRAITLKHDIPSETIAVWDGSVVCSPGETRLIWENGAVSVNKWQPPAYRGLGVSDADFGIAGRLINVLFPRERERAMVVNWLAWNLQNEEDKPGWSLFLYSKSKGTGKSTFCTLAAKLFGEANSVSQNNVTKLTSQFNTTALNSKLVISEEIQLRQNSTQSNSLKTLITEKAILAERKGMEAERLEQGCCFLFTSNHLPTWIEADDRRYYVVEVDHDGHAAGPEAARFSDLVARVIDQMNDPDQLAKLYNALIAHPVPDDFNPRSLNIARNSTDVMKRLQASSSQITVEQLEEFLNALDEGAVPESRIVAHVREQMHLNANAVRHMMSELGWRKERVKWGGVDYARAIWVKPEYVVQNGYVFGPRGNGIKVKDSGEFL